MAKLLKLRRGTTSQHSSFTGAEGEVTIDTDKDTAVVHDGSTAAGRALAREDLNNVASASITGRLSSGAIATAKIADNAITATQIAANAVGQSEIADDAVGSSQIADNAVGQAAIATNGVGEAEIASNAVTSSKIAANAINASHIADGTVVAADIGANAVGSSELADNAVDRNAIQDNAVNGDKITDGAINSEHYAAASIDHAHLANDIIDGDNIVNGAINSEHYAATSIDHTHLSHGIVDGDILAADAVNASHIQANAVGGSELANNSVDSDHIVTAAIDEPHLNITNSGSDGQALTRAGTQFTWATISPDGGNAATLDSIDSASFLRSDTADTATNDITFSGGAGACSIAGASDIRLTDGSWTGDTTAPKLQAHSNFLYVCGGSGGVLFRYNGTDRCRIDSDGHFRPSTNNTYDLGSSSYRWRNIYTNDLNLSNEGSVNDIDGTWGNYTIQEGEDELFLLNRRNGKKYKFNLTEVH